MTPEQIWQWVHDGLITQEEAEKRLIAIDKDFFDKRARIGRIQFASAGATRKRPDWPPGTETWAE